MRTPITKRINVVMPAATLKTLDWMARPGQRHDFITRAVEHYVATQSPDAIQKLLEMTSVRDRDLDQQISEDWQEVDRLAWQHIDQPSPNKPPKASRSAAKSSSRR